MNFTYSEYKKMVETSLDYEYEICSYKDVYKYDKAIILRHDIDFSPSKALQIARIEHELNVKSTFFVLVSTDFYSIFSKETSQTLIKILEMGHEIGLHFDEQRYEGSSLEEMKEYIYKESKVLEDALDISINVISMHRPSKFALESNLELGKLINSYNHTYFKEMKYVSDSRMHWREDVMHIIESTKFEKIHILTHPFWYSHKLEGTNEKLICFINESKKDRYKSLKNNFKNLDEYVKREDIEW